MASRGDISNGRLVYTCNCGWIDTGHANPRSSKPFIGANSLWAQIRDESGKKSGSIYEDGFKVTYKQSMGAFGMTKESSRDYFVRYGLKTGEKERVALAIFMEISFDFETLQGEAPQSLFSGASSFSQEDLVSNLVGFYAAVRGTNWRRSCIPVSTESALAVWDAKKDMGGGKNHSWRPILYTCNECQEKKQPSLFPSEFITITPIAKGTWHRDWRSEDDIQRGVGKGAGGGGDGAW